jgi:hypothetical protein
MINRRRIMGFPVKAPEKTDLEGFTEGYRLHATQFTYKQAGHTLSRYFDVIGGHTLRVNLGPISDFVFINEYNEDHLILERHNRNAPPTDIKLISNTTYIRFSSRTNDLDNYYVYDLTDKKWIWRGKNVKRPN